MNKMQLRKIVLVVGSLSLMAMPWGSAAAEGPKESSWKEIWIGPAADAFVDSGDHPILLWGDKKPANQANFGAEKRLAVRRGISGGFLGKQLGWQGTLIRFDLSTIPSSAEILEADLYLYHFGIWQEQISVHRLEKNWREMEASWQRPCDSCEPWSEGWKNGNFRQGATANVKVGRQGWYSWDVKGDIREYLAGLSNYGWLLKSAVSEGNDPTPTHFFSREMNQGEMNPRLRVRYQNAVPPLTIQITTPGNGTVLHESPVTVTGTVSDPAAAVTVNGVLASITGNTFQASIPLNEGANTIVASAEDPSGRKVSSQISLSLITRGNVEGMVSDASTSVPLLSASVSVTDTLSMTHSALTGQDGRYRMSGVAAGAFSGSISREGYRPFHFSGTMIPGQTVGIDAALNPIVPAIANIFVADAAADSARIIWVTDMPADSRVDYGSTPAYGNSREDSSLITTHQVTLSNLSPETIYHFQVTSRNVFGFGSSSGDQTFTTPALTNPLTLAITSPQNGATISRSDVRVEGTIINTLGLETGVVVNGVLANVLGNQFTANHVPLAEGENAISALATDTKGNKQAVSIIVGALKAENYIKLSASVESGIAPLETFLMMESSLDLAGASLTYQGPGEVELISTEGTEYRFRIAVEGNYVFTARVADAAGTIYEDVINISALSKAELENRLASKWEGMTEALLGGNIEGALDHFAAVSKNRYQQVFVELGQGRIRSIFSSIEQLRLYKSTGRFSSCGAIRRESGGVYSYPVTFVRDGNGIWKIAGF